MKNLEAKTVVTEDRYAYMNAKTFKEFLELYKYENSDVWAETLLKWLIFTYVDDWETLHHLLLIPHRLCWSNGEIDIYEDDITRGGMYYIGDNSATLSYECWRDRENTICWIRLHWQWTNSNEQLFMDRTNMTKNDKDEWERIFKMIQWVVWKAEDDGKTEGEKTIEPTFCKQDVFDAILEWTERNADKLQ